MDKLGWKGRLAVVLSVGWLLLLYALVPKEDSTKAVVGFGMLPLGFLWGVAWAIQGYRKQHPSANDPDATKRRRASTFRFFLGLGILAGAIWYSHGLIGESVSHEIGYWVVFALILWGILRALPKVSDHAVILTIAAYSATICFQAYRSHKEIEDLKREIAVAAPFILRTNSGEVISETELDRANLGRLEPFIRATARYTQEQSSLIAEYQKEVAALQLDKLLDPRVLGSIEGRKISSERLDQYKRALDKLDAGLKDSWQRYFDQVSVVAAQMPPEIGNGFKSGVEKRNTRVRPLLAGWFASQRSVIQHSLDLADYIAKLGPRVTVVQSPPNLLFSDAQALSQYRVMMDRFVTLAEEEERWKKQILDDERQSAQSLVDLVESGAK
jgi:hypothetical protein